MKTAIIPWLTVLAAAALPVVLSAQNVIPALSPEELAARRQSVVNLEAHIAQRGQRVGAIIADIRALDDRVETGVDQIVKTMSGVKDSESSKVRISQIKADVMTGLKRTIDYYNTHRDSIREQLRTGKTALPKETLEKDLAILDGRVDKRVKQIAEIAKSFPDPKELEKYETTAVAGWDGGWYANEEISEAWKQNRRDSRHTGEARNAFTRAMNDAIDHLRQRNAYLAGKLQSPDVPEAEKNYYRSEISRNEAIVGQRTNELQHFASGGSTAAVPVMPDQAHDLDQLVQSSRNDLREDFFAIFRKYAELNRARSELKQLQDNLAARKEWLANYDAQHPG